MRSMFTAMLACSALALSSALAQGVRTTLNYEDADLKAVAAELAARTGYSFIVAPRLSGRVNIISPPGVGLTPEEIFEVFVATLQVNNFTVIPAGNRIYKIAPIEQSARDAGAV